MQTKDFYFDLPEELIAQFPSTERGQDKLLHLDKKSGKVTHYEMDDFLNLVDENTLLVFNNSKVRRSRTYGIKLVSDKTRNQQVPTKPIEFLILQEVPELFAWRAMVKNAKRQKIGMQYRFPDGTIGTIIENPLDEGTEFRTLTFNTAITEEWFEKNGHIPLPPYIKREDVDSDSERYQNVYAKETGSAACPTAGLHFTKTMLEKIAQKGIDTAYVTLHVGLGTFLPVRVDSIEDHVMHEEVFSITEENAKKINDAISCGKKILAVGTTSVRTLESAWDEKTKSIRSGTSSTKIFIYPGYQFKVVQQLFTNFHTPESTLMMLVSAFAGKENIMNAYKNAIEHTYRFFSYGDAMLIQ
ncbi:MAG: tRNA preQ1(34) S-adenosylmethionine ribosyltransferase-isomerase QueA [Spirochaetaceae bacterium]|nr:tRNA preQ1(34) S-adenosylmethionine ribosyltransferase-isomerase QueA [Spirochaetaceae bacterium]